ncbi:MAG TPA: GWxTD domain-containing protein [Bacteroidales bacterium]|nr:GWxTD domain-containing protein [Bacteroidales bacterium]
MKKIIIFILLISLSIILFSQETSNKQIKAFLNYNNYYSFNNGPYIEFYLSILPNNLSFSTEAAFPYEHAKVSILLLIKDSSNNIADFAKLHLIIPKDSINMFNDVFSHLFSFNLKPGIYNLELSMRDEFDTLRKSNFNTKFYVPRFDTIAYSGIQLLDGYSIAQNDDDAFNKGGYQLKYRPINIFEENDSLLYFYFEIYNFKNYDTNKQFLLCIYLEDLNNRQILEKYYFTKKMDIDNFIGFIGNFNISKLPSGNYALVSEAINTSGITVAQVQLPIYVDHPSILPYQIVEQNYNYLTKVKNLDSLHEFLRILTPISSSVEVELIKKYIKSTDTNEIKQFIYAYWANKDPQNPEKAWQNYLEKIEAVNQKYSTQIRKGYLTDRGRVYLKYGPPNTIVQNENEPNAFPYEIWHYYEVNGEFNKKFVFYNPSLTYNNYELLHSDVRGEYNNPNWRQRLARKVYSSGNPEDDNPEFGWGSKVNDYFDNPR